MLRTRSSSSRMLKVSTLAQQRQQEDRSTLSELQTVRVP